jgi:class 3 adenylate cyclase
VELRGDDIAGLAVNIAARIMALATDGEILVSELVSALVAGSSQFRFDPRGDFQLKGIDQAVTVLAA